MSEEMKKKKVLNKKKEQEDLFDYSQLED